MTRLARLQGEMSRAGLHAVAVLPGPTFFYLTGLTLHLMERPVVAVIPSDDRPMLVVPEVEAGNASSSTIPFLVYAYGEDEGSRARAFSEVGRRLGGQTGEIGAEGRGMRMLELDLLQRAAPEVRIRQADDLIGRLRMVKEPEEIQSLREAVRIAESAIQQTVRAVRVGASEREIAAEVVLQNLRAGSDPELPSVPVVASGPNTALPHAVPGTRAIQYGDLLILDGGATYRGYMSDITRTFAVGGVTDELVAVYDTVRQANLAAREAVRPGARARDVDAAARSLIAAAGHGAEFVHRTGHGIGLEEHEQPFIRDGDDLELAPGMTFTIEPGIYQPGRGGVRIEDDVLVTANGSETLSTLTRDLRVIC